MAAGDLTIVPGAVLGDAGIAHGVGEGIVPAGSALDDDWSPPLGMACRSALSTCQGAWIGTFGELSSTFTSIGDKLVATVGTVGSSEDDSADQFDRARSTSDVDVDVGKYERYR